MAAPVFLRRPRIAWLAIPVGVIKVVRENLSNETTLAAEFKPYQEVEVHAKVSGYVKDIFVDVGAGFGNGLGENAGGPRGFLESAYTPDASSGRTNLR